MIRENSVSEVSPHGSCEHSDLEVTALAGEIGDGVPMTYSSYFLFDDRPFIKILSRVVSSGANELDPSTMSLRIRSCSSKGGQEGVMNIDDSIAEWLYNLGAQDTHVSGQNDQV